MTDKCQAPGLECEECRLKCQLPLIEAEKAQRERRGVENRFSKFYVAENEALRTDLNRLQVALEATIKEKEQYKRAFEEICHQFNFGDEKDYQAMHDTFLELARKGGEK